MLATLVYIADVETLDQPVSHLEDVRHQSVGKEIAFKVTHHLMNFDCNFPLAVMRDLEGLDMRIDARPLAFPIAAHLIASVDVATFHSIGPNYVGLHGREDALNVAAIEEGIDPSEEFHVIRHSVISLDLRRLSHGRCGKNSTLCDGGASCQAPLFLYCGYILMLQENPERESVRDQQQRNDESRNEVGGSQLPRCEPGAIGLIESVDEIG
jgi:hypothetical protein